ncbi:MAG: ABC transporter substrate-binding protein [Candidatus Hodarchaeota archaeon]
MKITGGIVIIVIIIIILVFSGQRQQEEGPIKIGVIGPLTGDVSEYGQNVKNTLNIALEEINEQGGIREKKLQLIYEDSACEPAKGVTAIQKLINIDGVSFVIDIACSSVVLAEAPIAEDNKVLLMSVTASNYKIKDAGDYIFRVYPSDAFQGKELAKLINSSNHKSVAIVYINNDYGFGLKKVFQEEFKSLGGEIVAVESHEAGITDFRSLLAKIKTVNPEAIFLAEHPKEGSLLLKQIKELEIEASIYGSDAMKDQTVLQGAGSAAENLIMLFSVLPKDTVYEQFNSLYKAKYGKDVESYAEYGYDALKVLAYVMDKTGLDPTKIKNELYKIKDFEGITGLISFDEFGERVSVDYETYIVKNGQFMPYE